jgi:dolichyl-phosphate-mannose--protein O-mannosyl transferase
MFLAEQVVTSTFTPFDIFMVIFTVLLAVGLIRLSMQRPRKNLFAIGFATVSLLLFLVADAKMVSGW